MDRAIEKITKLSKEVQLPMYTEGQLIAAAAFGAFGTVILAGALHLVKDYYNDYIWQKMNAENVKRANEHRYLLAEINKIVETHVNKVLVRT